jgi:transitional endoplasmic reticulum ATPase
VNLEELSRQMEGYTGADIASLASTAVMLAMRGHISRYQDPKKAEDNAKDLKISRQHFEEAMKKVRPLSTKELDMYKNIAEQFDMPSRPTNTDRKTSIGIL